MTVFKHCIHTRREARERTTYASTPDGQMKTVIQVRQVCADCQQALSAWANR